MRHSSTTYGGATLVLGLCLGGLQGCRSTKNTVQSADSDLAGGADFVTKATAGAKSLNAIYNPYDIQRDPGDQPIDCRTLIVPASPDVPFKGTAVFFHGHTACPNQFAELAQILAKKGVNSFAPLLPGQGRAPVPLPTTPKKIDGKSFADYYGEFLPNITDGGIKRFQEFVHATNQVVAGLPGDKTVFGLSVGGELATYAYLEQPGLYKRAMLTSPFYGAPATYIGTDITKPGFISDLQKQIDKILYDLENDVAVKLAEDMAVVGNLPFGWGDGCYVSNAGKPGGIPRRGICDFKIGNLAAAIGTGNDILGRLKALPKGAQLPQVQYIITEFDTGAGTVQMRRAAAMQQLATSDQQVRICANPHEVGHSFFARGDLNVDNPYWLNPFLQMATEFIANGTPYKADASKPSLEVAYDASAGKDSPTQLQRCSIYDVPYSEVNPG